MTLSENQEKLFGLIRIFKVIDMEQAYKLFKDLSPHIITININTLIKAKLIKLYHHKYLTCCVSERDSGLIDLDNVNCLWAIMAISCDLTDILNTMSGNSPSSYLYISNHQHTYSLIQVSRLKLINIRKQQEYYENQYHKNEKTLKLREQFLFVVDDIEFVNIINEYKLPFPYSIAYIKKEAGKDLPVIKTFHSDISNETEEPIPVDIPVEPTPIKRNVAHSSIPVEEVINDIPIENIPEGIPTEE